MASLITELYYAFLEPALCHLRLASPGGGDPTYGRARLPHSDVENACIYKNPRVTATHHTVPLNSQAMRKGGVWAREGSQWVAYYVWEIKEAVERENLNSDLVLLHGLNDYGGKLCPHASTFMEAGFRVIAVDLPSFGRSTGLHGYLPSMRLNVEAAHAVVRDVARRDGPAARGRKLFMEGHSMGGFTALYYAALYPPLSPPSLGGPSDASEGARPNLSGVAVAAPMITIAAESRPHYIVECIGRAIAFFAGRLPFAKAIKGKVSDDPRVETEFEQDQQTYHGLLRIGTGLAIVAGVAELGALAPRITCPIRIHHGGSDRVTSPTGSQAFFERVSSQDKSIKIWPGYEHVMMKNVNGMSEEDQQKRMAVLDDITQWFIEQAGKPTLN